MSNPNTLLRRIFWKQVWQCFTYDCWPFVDG